MDFQFDQLIQASIKRLTKPKFKHDFTTLYDPTAHQPLLLPALDEELATLELQNANDINFDGVDADAALNYNPSFGKICTGE